ncbi:armadillo-type protein [Haematococcus lacustris]
MEQLQAQCRAVEQACVNFQNPATQPQAEQMLLQFRQQLHPIAACRHILEHSSSQDARFQAALTLREALLREWGSLPSHETQGLCQYLLRCLLCPPGGAEGGVGGSPPAAAMVRNTLVAVLARAVKRGWLEQAPEVRGGLVQEVVGVVQSCGASVGGGPGAACQGLVVLEAVVAEFNPPSSSPMGLPWDFHERCARELEEVHLRSFFATSATVAQQATQSGASLRGEDGGVAAAAARLMTACLQWDFKRGSMPCLPAVRAAAKAPGPEGVAAGLPSSLSLHQSWSGLLLDPGCYRWLVGALAQMRAAYGPSSSWQGGAVQRHGPLASLPPGQHAHVLALAAAARQLLVALCSVGGEVFPKLGQGEQRQAFLQALLQALLPWLWPPDAALSTATASGLEGSELFDACRSLAALAATHKARALQQAGSLALAALMDAQASRTQPDPALVSIPGAHATGFLGLIEAVTLFLIRSGGVSASGSAVSLSGDDQDRYWLHECTELLLETWWALLQPEGSVLSLPADHSHLPQGVTAAASSVFQACLEAGVLDAARGATEEVADAHEEAASAGLDDWLARAAALARYLPSATFPAVAQALAQTQQRLASAAAAGSDPSEALEQLVWLVRLAGHCLADSGSGETPLLPLTLATAVEAGVAGAVEGCVQLSEALLALPALVLSPGAQPVMSPRLMEVCLWALARWADTYLYPEAPLPGALHLTYSSSGPPPPAPAPGQAAPNGPGMHTNTGAGGGGASGGVHAARGLQVLEMAVQVANTCLTAYPGEGALHSQVCSCLLPVLVRRRTLCERLVQLPAWQALAAAFAARQPVLVQGLQQKLHRALAQSLVMAAVGQHTSRAAAAYIAQLLAPLCQEVERVAHLPSLEALAARGDVVAAQSCLLEGLRGATRATLSRTQPTLYALTRPLLQPLLVLQRAFRAHPSVQVLLLKLAAEVVEHHVSYLQADEVDQLLRWVLALLQQYVAGNTWAAQLAGSKSHQEVLQQEVGRELCALLKLLGHVTQHDLGAGGGHADHTDASRVGAATAANSHSASNGPQQTVDTAQVVLFGLSVLLPFMSEQLLKYPKLPRLYFNLLAYIMESYAEQVAALDPRHLVSLLSSLEFGVSHTTDTLVLHSALEGLAGLSGYIQKRAAAGAPPLTMATGSGQRTVAAHFLELLLRRLLLSGDCSQDVVELAADALQPLLLVEPAAYADLAGQIIQVQQHDASLKEHITAAMASLVRPPAGGQADGPSHGSRVSRRAFRQTLCQAVSSVRGMLQVR